MKIGYVFASRERPSKFFDCLDNIRSKSESKNYFIIAKIDTDDPKADQYKDKLPLYPEVSVKWGHSKNKIDSINRNLSGIENADIICCHSDDMSFTKFWYDVLIKEAMKNHFPDFDGMLHFPDQKQKEKVCTYQIVGRKYFQRTGYIYNPEYESVYCDNEETERAKLLGKYAFINEEILIHKHYRWGFGEPDELNKREDSQTLYIKDRDTYLKRKQINFGI